MKNKKYLILIIYIIDMINTSKNNSNNLPVDFSNQINQKSFTDSFYDNE